MTTASQDLGLTSHSKDSAFYIIVSPYTGALGPTETAGWAPPAGLTNTSSKYAEDSAKPKNVQELEDFSEEQQAVELLRTNEGLMNNYHKTERQSWIILETIQIIKIHFDKFSYSFVLWRIYIYISIWYVK